MLLSCVLWKGVAENTVDYCRRGDILGVKGHLQTRLVPIDEETKRQAIEVVAEKVTFLTNKRREQELEEKELEEVM